MKISPTLVARVALFIVYFWFGILKVFGTSPANPLVAALLEKTLPFISFGHFIIIFGIFECAIGIMFLFQKLDKITITLFALHILTTVMPLVLVPVATWYNYFTPTLEGQYILKNVILIALVFLLAAYSKPSAEKKSNEEAPHQGRQKVLVVSRPWGKFETITQNVTTTVKVITVNPGQALSLQTHAKRSEYWRVLSGTGEVVIGDKHIPAVRGSEFSVDLGVTHRIRAYGNPMEVLEISFGHFDEDDIVRLEDIYNRT